MAVAAPARGQGVAARLVQRLLREADAGGIRPLAQLTTGADGDFVRHGFVRVARDRLPAVLATSAELTGACPCSAIAMLRNA